MNHLPLHLQHGRLGEEIACRLLTQLDYRILHRNWKNRKQEVDIIANDHGEYVFVEVKMRTQEGFYTAHSAVDEKKRRNIRIAAKAYMRFNAPEYPFRFDIITVVGTTRPYKVTHYKRVDFDAPHSQWH